MPAKKAAPLPGRVVPKKHFFTPRSEVPEGEREVVQVEKVKPPVVEEMKPRFQPRPRYLIDADTDVAYAEIVDGVAICLETGQEMFEVHSSRGDDESVVPMKRKFNFTSPTSRQSCTIVSQDLIDAGVLTEGHFIAGEAGLSRAQYEGWMAGL